MGRTIQRVVVTCLSLVLIVGLPASAWGLTDSTRAARGAAYLVSQQRPDGSIPAFSPIGSTSDAVLAFVASGVGGTSMGKAIGYLRTQTAAGNVNSLGLRAKVVLALDAAGKDPSAFGGHDLLSEISSTLRTNGRFGTDPLLDDALAVLGLVSAGQPPVARASTWLLKAQCPDGGWAYDEPYNPKHDNAHCHSGSSDFYDSDSNTTSYVVMALVATRHTGWSASPFAFFDTLRDPDKGGWSYDRSFIATDANSTSLVLQAYTAAGVHVPSGALAALRGLQHPDCGAWAYSWSGGTRGDPDVGATIAAIPAVLLDPLPIAPGAVKKGVPAVPACS
jgi:prenyltransferase/squalene oxidase-like repeat protein